MSVELVLATVIVCRGVAGPLSCPLKVSALGLNANSGVPLTYRVTGNCSGLFGAGLPVAGLVALIETVPLHRVPAAIPDVTTPALNTPSVEPLVAPPICSQLPPQEVTEVGGEEFSETPVLLETRIDCAGSGACPTWLGNTREHPEKLAVEQPLALTTITGSLVTFRLTAICSGLLAAPAAVTVTVPV